MLKNVWIWILTNVFKVKTETKQTEINDNSKYAIEYQRIDDINFSSIFSNKIANYVVNDSNINIEGENPRTELLDKLAQSMWKKSKKITSMALGFGGVFLVPYTANGKIYYNIVPQNRVSIDKTDGDLITECTILADKKVISNAMASKTYVRWQHMKIENGNVVIEQKYCDENGHPIPTPEFWNNIAIKQTFTNVDRVLIGYIKSPINNRKSNDKYGVPITYGCEATIKEIKECMKQIAKEFELKEAFVGVDYTVFNEKTGSLPKSGLYKLFDSGKEDMFEVFDPAFRDTSYYNRLQELYIRLEKEVGTSKGILSEVQTQNATATEIKRSMYDTFTIVDDMRNSIEKGLEDFFYACNVIANVYNLSPQAEYEITYDWSYSLLEDAQNEFNQLMQGLNQGIIGKDELRQWLKPSETLEQAQEKIKKIQSNEPSIEDLIPKNKEEENIKEKTEGKQVKEELEKVGL